MKTNNFSLYLLILIVLGNREPSAQSNELFLLPDGTSLPLWDDQTVYTKIYCVDQNHPKASDQNPGTESNPLLTINQAAKMLRPVEKVIIKKGGVQGNC